MPSISCRLSCFLDFADSIVAHSFIGSDCEGDIVLACFAETDGQSDAVFHCLRCSLDLIIRINTKGDTLVGRKGWAESPRRVVRASLETQVGRGSR